MGNLHCLMGDSFLGDQLFLEGIYNKIVAQTWADVTVFLNSSDKHFLCLRGWLAMATTGSSPEVLDSKMFTHEPRGTDVGKVSCSRCKKGAALWNALPLIRTYIFTSFKFHALQFDEKTHLQ